MEFCNKCDNIYYIEINNQNGVLTYKCKKCKNKVPLNKNKPYLMKTNIQKKKSSYEYIINEYTKYDNTLPRIKHIKCPKCSKKSPVISQPQPQTQPQVQPQPQPQDQPRPQPQAQPQDQPQPQPQAQPQDQPQPQPQAQPQDQPQSQAESESSSDGWGVNNINDNYFDIDDREDDEFNTIMDGGGSIDDSENNEVIYIRYDDINLKYIYLCCNPKCNYIWKL